jgi:hypothetical protein
MLCALAVTALALVLCTGSNSASAGMLDVPATSSETSTPTASVNHPACDPALFASTTLASTTFSHSLAILLAPESGDQLAQSILPLSDLPEINLLESNLSQTGVKLSRSSAATADFADRLAAMERQRAGLSLKALFRGGDNNSLVTFFVGMAFVGIVVAGIRLETLRRRSEQAAFYGSELASHHRRHRHRSAVIYVQTPSRTSGSFEPRRRRRRSSRHSSTQHSSKKSGFDSTHPITIESRLAG